MKYPLLACVVFSLCSAIAPAAIVGNTFTGVTTPGFAPEDLATEFPTGTKWTLVVEWDDAATPESFPDQARFPATKLTLTLQGKSGAWTTSAKADKAAYTLGTYSGVHSIQFTTSWGPENVTNPTIGSMAPYSINLYLEDPTRTAIGSMTQAPGKIDLSKWSASKSYLKVYLNEGNQYLYGSVNLSAGTPDIAVKQPANKDLKDGKSVISFSDTGVGKKGEAKTFTIRNTGKGPLKDLAVKISGKGKSDFTVTAPGKTTLAAGQGTEFKVTFKPKKSGVREADLKILSNDPNESPFDIGLKGKGTKAKKAPVALP